MKHDKPNPMGEFELLERLGNVRIPRRLFLQAAGVAAGSVAGAITTEIAFDVLPKLVENLVLTPAEEQLLLEKILGRTTRFGIGMYPDFDLLGDVATQDVFQLEGQKKEVMQIGFFALIEDANELYKMDAHRRRIQAIEGSGQIPQISLGMGSIFRPHPFDESNLDTQKKLIDTWVEFLTKSAKGVVHVRFLYEANLYKGDIAYRNAGMMSAEVHQASFKRLFEYFSTSIHRNNESNQRILLDLSFSAAGAGIVEYLPQCPVRATGIDIYCDIYGRYALWSLYEHVFDIYCAMLKNYILVDALTKVKTHFGDSTRVVLHEIGATDEDLEWFKSALLLFLAAGGEEILYFGIDKTTTEQRNFSLTPAKISILRQMFSS